MKNITLLIGILILMLTSQCKKKEIILKDGIGVLVNEKNVDINEIIFTKEENGLRFYLIFNNELINIYTNNRNIGSYRTSYNPDLLEEENYSYVLCNKDGNIYRASSGSFEISQNSNSTYSGSFKFNFNLIDYEIDCVFEQIETVDIMPLIEGLYIGLANEPYSNDALKFHDFNSRVLIQSNNDTTNMTIASIDTSFQDWTYNNISSRYVMSMNIDKQTDKIIIDRKVTVFGTYENNPLVVASVNIEEPLMLSIFDSYYFRKD